MITDEQKKLRTGTWELRWQVAAEDADPVLLHKMETRMAESLFELMNDGRIYVVQRLPCVYDEERHEMQLVANIVLRFAHQANDGDIIELTQLRSVTERDYVRMLPPGSRGDPVPEHLHWEFRRITIGWQRIQ